MLGNRLSRPAIGHRFVDVHDRVYPGLLNQLLAIRRDNDGIHCLPKTVPQTSYIIPLNDLGESPCLDVADFDKLIVKEKYVRRMNGNAFGSAFPFDDTGRGSTGKPSLVDIYPEFW